MSGKDSVVHMSWKGIMPGYNCNEDMAKANHRGIPYVLSHDIHILALL